MTPRAAHRARLRLMVVQALQLPRVDGRAIVRAARRAVIVEKVKRRRH